LAVGIDLHQVPKNRRNTRATTAGSATCSWPSWTTCAAFGTLAAIAGTDVAIESGSLTLMSGDLRALVTAIALSRATMRNIKQNLFWAFAYNVALIPLAAGLFYPFTGCCSTRSSPPRRWRSRA
jgi:hypothetical protein